VEKNQRKSARNKSALICEKRNKWVHADGRRLKSADERRGLALLAEKKKIHLTQIFAD
jgi:hypothetical protein